MKLLRFIIPAIFAVLLLAYFVIVLPTPKANAHISYAPGQQDTCGHLTVSTSETIGNGTPNGDFFTVGDSYKTTATITSNAVIDTPVTVTWKTHWCESASQKLSGGACNENENAMPQTFTFNNAQGLTHTFDSDTRSSKEHGFSGMCGLFQNDLTFSYGNGCHSAFSNGSGNGNASWTYTYLWDGQHLTSTNPWTPDWQCHMVTVTPTSSPTPTMTLSPTMSPTTTPTNSPTPTTTTSISPTESPTPTVTPTGTVTVINSPTPTPTGTNSNNCGNNNQSGNNDNNNCSQSSSSSSGGSSSSSSTVNVGGITVTNNNSNSQTQTQNNNQTQSQSQTGQVLGASTTTQLPKTGTPLTLWGILGLFPLGFIIRKFATKA